MHVTEDLLHVQCLSYAYGTRPVLDRVDLRLGVGASLALLGASGSGKSTLLHALAGLLVPTSGTIHFKGQNLTQLSADARAQLRRRDIALLHQAFHLLPTMTAEENVTFPLLTLGIVRDERRARCEALLREMEVWHRRAALPSEMSGGEQQRVALARALMVRPALILADEPTGNLDSANGARVIELIRSACAQHQTALIVATHDTRVAEACARRLHICDGRLQDGEIGAPAVQAPAYNAPA